MQHDRSGWTGNQGRWFGCIVCIAWNRSEGGAKADQPRGHGPLIIRNRPRLNEVGGVRSQPRRYASVSPHNWIYGFDTA